MDQKEAIQEALAIVKAQASVRTMSAEEITGMVQSVAAGIMAMGDAQDCPCIATSARSAMDPKKAIKEASIVCCECGKSFKVITRKHLATHGLTPEEYRAKYGYKKTQALACKSLARERRKTMQKSKLWERRKKPETIVQQ
ncbi:Ros/MucR family transcriptional regulator [Solidesulfovibrio sp.]